MTNEAETIKLWITEINERGKSLTKWEENFMESVTEQFANWKRISDRQEEILEQIYANKT